MEKQKITQVVLILLFSFSLSIKAQLPINEKTGKVEYSEVVQLDGISKGEIYKRAKMWVVTTLKSGDNMVELDGTDSNQIVATGNLQLTFDSEMRIKANKLAIKEAFLNFKFIILCKDGKFKYKVSNFDLTFIRNFPGEAPIHTGLEQINTNGFSKKSQESLEHLSKISVDANVKQLINDFVSSIMNSSTEEDW